ncbi:MAG: LysE family transporter [Candidatus Paracaedibacteraceae bacterium]|nr:LysE family transporter [Candidatus Paracaedibacteraceae bacterium]
MFQLFSQSLVTLATVNLIALISPGPDFAVVLKNSLLYSRRTALFTAMGIASAAIIHVIYTLLGLGVVLDDNPWILNVVKYLGAGYLIYLGIKGIMTNKEGLDLGSLRHRKDIGARQGFSNGFFTNLLNPKCAMFFISLFSVAISPDVPVPVMVSYVMIVFVETIIWFSIVAFCLTGKTTREKFASQAHWISRLCGVILLGLGVEFIFM